MSDEALTVSSNSNVRIFTSKSSDADVNTGRVVSGTNTSACKASTRERRIPKLTGKALSL